MNGKKKVLHLLAAGDIGGIESLMVDYYKYSTLENQFCFFWSMGKNASRLKSLGAKMCFLDVYHHSTVATFCEFYKYCKQNEIETIVTHHSSPLIWLYAILAKKLLQIKVYVYAHSNASDMLESNTKKYHIKKILLNYLAKRSDGVIAISNSVKQSLISFGKVDSKKITVAYNGIDGEIFHTNSKENVEKGEVQITFAGRLIPQKGVHLLLQALAMIEKQESIKHPFQCYIIGEGKERTTLEELAIKLGLEEVVHFEGKRYDVPEWLKRSDIFIHPAIWEEGFGIGIVEAMAAGNLCIVFDRGALSEIITNEVDGYILQDASAETLCEKINYVIQHIGTKEIADIRRKAVITADKFDIRQTVKEFDKIIGGNE